MQKRQNSKQILRAAGLYMSSDICGSEFRVSLQRYPSEPQVVVVHVIKPSIFCTSRMLRDNGQMWVLTTASLVCVVVMSSALKRKARNTTRTHTKKHLDDS